METHAEAYRPDPAPDGDNAPATSALWLPAAPCQTSRAGAPLPPAPRAHHCGTGAAMITAPGILVARSFPGTPDQVGAARRWLEDTLTRTPGLIPDETTAAAALLLSEAATSALRHTSSGAPGGTFTVHVHADRHTLTVVVQDAGGAPRRPEQVTTSTEDDHGRGLTLVAAFADTWAPLPTGNGITFTLRLGPAPTATAESAGARTGVGVERPR